MREGVTSQALVVGMAHQQLALPDGFSADNVRVRTQSKGSSLRRFPISQGGGTVSGKNASSSMPTGIKGKSRRQADLALGVDGRVKRVPRREKYPTVPR